MCNSIMGIQNRLANRVRIGLSLYGGRRMVLSRPEFPIVSFSFDDFPESALRVAGRILERHNVGGTYYTSLGLMDREIPAGKAFSKEDLKRVVDGGHELGCHTYAHCHAWETEPKAFEASILENQRELEVMFPGLPAFRTLSYPIACPRPGTKRLAAKHFLCCRGGGRAITGRHLEGTGERNPALNIGYIDANNLQTFFLEKSCDDPTTIKRLIDLNARMRGWLIFATHDVSDTPTKFGCKTEFFEDVVQYAVSSGARILPVSWGYSACVK
jgi:peptidoglycan/xylan/chitin deacetylase (PgdA/CDA1 family)